MKKLILLFFAVGIYVAGFSQAISTIAQYQKTQQPALQVEIPFPSKTVDKAVDDKFSKLGYKGSSDKDYTVYKGARLQEISTDPYDLYFKSDRKSRDQKDVTVLTLLISSGYQKFIGDSTNLTLINNAKLFLDSLVNTVAAYDLEQQISDQQNVVKKAGKKLSDLSDNGQDLAKKQKKLQQDIADNTQAQATQQAELSKQQQILTTLISQRKQ
jgi:hypothetical protein